MKKLLIAFLITTSSLLYASEEILIEEPSLVAQLNRIQSNLDEVSAAVMLCMETSKKHMVCICESKEKIIEFNTSVKSLIEKHKVLDGSDLIRFKSTDGSWVTQSIKGLVKQANIELPSCS